MKKRSALTNDQLENLKSIVEEKLSGLIFKNVYKSEDFNLDNEDRSDDVDLANADASNSQLLRFRNREVFYVKKLNKALKRMEKGKYALCEECEEPIGYQRLLARPTAEYCIVCKEESEREETGNYLSKQSKSLGKKVDMVQHI